MRRAVIDTNVLVSGIISKNGFPYKVVKAWETGGLILITSPEIVTEANRVLNYPKIKKKYSLKDADIRQTILNLLRYSVFVENPPSLNVIKEDAEDNNILSAAVAGKADFIITGDVHLLRLGSYLGVEILTPKKFCAVAEI